MLPNLRVIRERQGRVALHTSRLFRLRSSRVSPRSRLSLSSRPRLSRWGSSPLRERLLLRCPYFPRSYPTPLSRLCPGCLPGYSSLLQKGAIADQVHWKFKTKRGALQSWTAKICVKCEQPSQPHPIYRLARLVNAWWLAALSCTPPPSPPLRMKKNIAPRQGVMRYVGSVRYPPPLPPHHHTLAMERTQMALSTPQDCQAG